MTFLKSLHAVLYNCRQSYEINLTGRRTWRILSILNCDDVKNDAWSQNMRENFSIKSSSYRTRSESREFESYIEWEENHIIWIEKWCCRLWHFEVVKLKIFLASNSSVDTDDNSTWITRCSLTFLFHPFVLSFFHSFILPPLSVHTVNFFWIIVEEVT